MKQIKIFGLLLGAVIIASSCDKDDDMPAATVYYEQQDQMARPAINTVFVTAAGDKDAAGCLTRDFGRANLEDVSGAAGWQLYHTQRSRKVRGELQQKGCLPNRR